MDLLILLFLGVSGFAIYRARVSAAPRLPAVLPGLPQFAEPGDSSIGFPDLGEGLPGVVDWFEEFYEPSPEHVARRASSGWLALVTAAISAGRYDDRILAAQGAREEVVSQVVDWVIADFGSTPADETGRVSTTNYYEMFYLARVRVVLLWPRRWETVPVIPTGEPEPTDVGWVWSN